MTWHLEPITLHGRRYVAGKTFEDRDQYATIVTVQLMGRVAFLCGMHNDKEAPIQKEDLEDLAAMLRAKYGVEVIHAERRSKPREYDTAPAPLG